MVLSSVRCVLRKGESLPRIRRGRRAGLVGLDPSLAGRGPSAGRPRSGRYPASVVVERVVLRSSVRRWLWLRSPAVAAGPAAWLRKPVGDASRSGRGRSSAARCRTVPSSDLLPHNPAPQPDACARINGCGFQVVVAPSAGGGRVRAPVSRITLGGGLRSCFEERRRAH